MWPRRLQTRFGMISTLFIKEQNFKSSLIYVISDRKLLVPELVDGCIWNDKKHPRTVIFYNVQVKATPVARRDKNYADVPPPSFKICVGIREKFSCAFVSYQIKDTADDRLLFNFLLTFRWAICIRFVSFTILPQWKKEGLTVIRMWEKQEKATDISWISYLDCHEL